MKQISLRGRAYTAVEDIVNSGAVTVSLTDLHFLKPIKNGNTVTAYTEIIKIKSAKER